MRRSFPPIRALFAAGLLAACTSYALSVGPDAPAAHGQDEVFIHLPLVMRRAERTDLFKPAPITVPTEPVRPTEPIETATASPTATFPATATDSPPPTLTPTGDGMITGKLLVGGEPAWEGLGFELGPGLFLQRCAADAAMSTCERIDKTGVVGDEGEYAFHNPPSLAAGDIYVVHWRNESLNGLFNDDNYVGAWYSKPIRGYSAGETNTVEDVEIKNFLLTGPSKGTGYSGLPWEFTWDVRAGEDETYKWTICDCCGEGEIAERENLSRWRWQSPSVGRRGAYLMNSHPPGSRIGIEYKYCWFVQADPGAGGTIWSNERWLLWWFFLDAFDDFGLVDTADWPARMR